MDAYILLTSTSFFPRHFKESQRTINTLTFSSTIEFVVLKRYKVLCFRRTTSPKISVSLIWLSLGYSNRIPYWVAYKQQKFISNNSEDWSPKSGYQQGRVLVRALLQIVDGQFLLPSSHGRKRDRELSGIPVIRPLILLMRALPSWPNYLQRLTSLL